MKRLKMLLLALLLVSGAMQAEIAKCLILHQDENSEISVIMAEHPIISFPNSTSMMVVSTDKNVYEVESSKISKIIIEDREISRVNNIREDETTVKYGADYLMIRVNSGEIQLAIYTLDGKTIMTRSLTAGETLIPVDMLPKGTLIIRIGVETIKVVR